MPPLSRVVVASRDPLDLEMLHRTLSAFGHRIIASATNGVDLDTLCRDLDPDLVVADIDILGLNAINALSRPGEGKSICPVIGLTNQWEEERIPSVDLCLVVPCNPLQLQSTIERMLCGIKSPKNSSAELCEASHWFG